MITLHLPTRELRHGAPAGGDTPTWDLYLDGRLVASGYTSLLEAQMELDLIAWSTSFGAAPLALDRPLTDEALGLALSAFNRLFTTLKIQEKARVALEQIIRPGIYTITADGDLSVLASSSRGRAGGRTAYAITAQPAPRTDAHAGAEAEAETPVYAVSMACECRDFWTRGREHGGVCKHIAARLLLFLAQQGVGFLKHLRDALDTHQLTAPPIAGTSLAAPAASPAPTTAGDAMAFLDIAAPDLLAALFLVARAGTPVTLRIDARTLHLCTGAITLTLPGLDGGNIACVRLDVEPLTALYDQLRPVARTAGVITLFIEPSDGTVVLSGSEGSFSALARGTSLPITPSACAEAAAQSDPVVPTPAPLAESPVVAALHELFILLETHEPDWYLRRHYRVAHDALQSAGHLAARS